MVPVITEIQKHGRPYIKVIWGTSTASYKVFGIDEREQAKKLDISTGWGNLLKTAPKELKKFRRKYRWTD